ncbi:hypothetical protein LQF59_06965 [Tetragenococcus koreensis]|uniref:hypothetical protein n=1 Tax=Tetragenococcus koreensis TaxID=290335 RepID=UPI001F1A4351|nr:hypothetical protein [Tetragenococcus koreensis]MCF1614802.1 hypothetical protein [Tetragenococcus koreensis]MCF1624634.1 hypothetical protein [Tetragenococcus koreensis]
MAIKIYSDYEDSNIAVDEVNKLYKKYDTESARKLKVHKGATVYYYAQIAQKIQDLNSLGYEEAR